MGELRPGVSQGSCQLPESSFRAQPCMPTQSWSSLSLEPPPAPGLGRVCREHGLTLALPPTQPALAAGSDPLPGRSRGCAEA